MLISPVEIKDFPLEFFAKPRLVEFSRTLVASFWSLITILGPILFNIFLKDVLSTMKLSDLFNFADDNTISTTADNIDHLLLTLKHKSNGLRTIK